ncbi:MAG: tryptophan synthase subunit alpha [Pseudomonadota bacterium]
MSNRYGPVFQQVEAQNRIAFIPFVTLGDPDIETSKSIIKTLIASGADALELGFPFSDPIADGPTIQKASIRALDNQVTIEQSLQLLKEIREEYPDIPIGLLTYCNLVMRGGVDAFYQRLSKIGVDSILVADVPLLEAHPFLDAAKKYALEQVLILPPDASDDVVHLVAEHSQGYVYMLSRAGVTGTEVVASMPPDSMINRLTQMKSAPPVLGFGISKTEHVKAAKAAGAKGAISGSAVVRIIEENVDDVPVMLENLSSFVKDMRQAATR